MCERMNFRFIVFCCRYAVAIIKLLFHVVTLHKYEPPEQQIDLQNIQFLHLVFKSHTRDSRNICLFNFNNN